MKILKFIMLLLLLLFTIGCSKQEPKSDIQLLEKCISTINEENKYLTNLYSNKKEVEETINNLKVRIISKDEEIKKLKKELMEFKKNCRRQL